MELMNALSKTWRQVKRIRNQWVVSIAGSIIGALILFSVGPILSALWKRAAEAFMMLPPFILSWAYVGIGHNASQDAVTMITTYVFCGVLAFVIVLRISSNQTWERSNYLLARSL